MTRRGRAAAILGLALLLGACQTTQQTADNLNAGWVGRPVDRFFVANGAPVGRFKLANGGTIYSWRGGGTTITETQVVRERDSFFDDDPFSTRRVLGDPRTGRPGFDGGRYRPSLLDDDFFRSETIVSREVPIVCEADIATDRRGRIVNITIRNDTRGAGIASSRCSEIFPQS